MKKIYPIIISFISLLSCFSCQKMDDNYKEYVVPDGIIYPGKATSPFVAAGEKRVRVSWLRSVDPKVEKARIYWNNYTDSVALDITHDMDTIRYLIDNLEENTYTFIIKTFDAKGNVSIPVEVSGRAYGPIYQAGLFNRNIVEEIVSEDDGWGITWEKGDIDKGATFTELSFNDSKGENKTVITPIEDMGTVVTDFKGGEYKYRTGYLPEKGAIDVFYSEYSVRTIPPQKIKKSNWSITASSDARDSQAPNGAPEKAIDDNPTTFWHSQHKPSSPGYPHWLAIDMKREVKVEYVELTHREAYPEQSFNRFMLQSSMDGTNWTDQGEFGLEPVALKVQKFVLEEKPTIRHIRIYMLQGGTVHAHLGEFSVYGSYAD